MFALSRVVLAGHRHQRLGLAAAVAMLAFAPGVVLGQSEVIQRRDAQQREQEKLEAPMRERFEQRNEAPVVDEPGTPPPTPEAPPVRFELKSLQTNPSSILSEEEIRAIASEYEGRSVSIDDIREMIGRFNKLYADKGFVTATANLPKQKVKDGVLRLEFIEARLGAVSYEGNKHTSEWFLEQWLPFSPGELVDVNALEPPLARFNKLHDAQTILTLQPGKEPGTTDYKVGVKEPPQFLVDLFSDNQGVDLGGPNGSSLRGGANLRAASLFGMRDPLAVGAYGSDVSIGTYINYELPITPWDTRLSGGFDYNDATIEIPGSYRPTGTIINGVPQLRYVPGPIVDSETKGGSLQLSHPLVASQNLVIRAFLGGEFRDTTREIRDSPLRNPFLSPDTRSVFGGIAGDWIDSYGTTSYSHRFAHILVDDEYGNFPDFNKYVGAVARFQPLARYVWANLRAYGQWSSADDDVEILRSTTPGAKPVRIVTGTTPPSEIITMGGMSSVRGYPEFYRSGQDGYAASIQINGTLPRTPELMKGDTSQFGGFVFFDHGATFRGDPNPLNKVESQSHLVGVGGGITITWNDYVSSQIAVGVPMLERSGISDTRVHFQFHITPPVSRWIDG